MTNEEAEEIESIIRSRRLIKEERDKLHTQLVEVRAELAKVTAERDQLRTERAELERKRDQSEQRVEYDGVEAEVEIISGDPVAHVRGYRCKYCHNPVGEPRPGRITRCLNPDCLNLGQLRRGGPGHLPKRFYFTYADLSKATGLSEGALRARACRKTLDPKKFASVAELLRQRVPKENP